MSQKLLLASPLFLCLQELEHEKLQVKLRNQLMERKRRPRRPLTWRGRSRSESSSRLGQEAEMGGAPLLERTRKPTG